MACYYSCIVNCCTLIGTCNVTCASLTANGINSVATYLFGSTITLHLKVNISLSPTESGFFVLHKYGGSFNRSNISITVLDNRNIMYHLYNAQHADSGMYQAEYIGTHPRLFSNTLFITVTSLNPTSTPSQLQPTMINSKWCSNAYTVHMHTHACIYVHTIHHIPHMHVTHAA